MGERTKLTQKEKAFVDAIVGIGRKPAQTLVEAYEAAYSTKGFKDRSNIRSEAVAVRERPCVSHAITLAMSRRDASAASVGREVGRWVVERLRAEAETAESPAARVRALELLGKVKHVRLFESDADADDSDRPSSSADLQAELERRLSDLLGSGLGEASGQSLEKTGD